MIKSVITGICLFICFIAEIGKIHLDRVNIQMISIREKNLHFTSSRDEACKNHHGQTHTVAVPWLRELSPLHSLAVVQQLLGWVSKRGWSWGSFHWSNYLKTDSANCHWMQDHGLCCFRERGLVEKGLDLSSFQFCSLQHRKRGFWCCRPARDCLNCGWESWNNDPCWCTKRKEKFTVMFL